MRGEDALDSVGKRTTANAVRDSKKDRGKDEGGTMPNAHESNSD